MKTDIKRLQSKENLAIYTADLFAELANQGIAQQGQCSVALSGGSTPKLFYEKLIELYSDDIHWNYINFFWSDERNVPFDHPESNGGLAYLSLLQPLEISKEQYFPVPTSYKHPAQGAMEYEETIRRYFNAPHTIPAFDIIFLGLGTDGHTASLFPGTKALEERRRLVCANWVESIDRWRITFAYPLLNRAKNVIFLASGSDKAQVVKEILKDKNTFHPAARVQPDQGRLMWLLDSEAGRYL